MHNGSAWVLPSFLITQRDVCVDVAAPTVSSVQWCEKVVATRLLQTLRHHRQDTVEDGSRAGQTSHSPLKPLAR